MEKFDNDLLKKQTIKSELISRVFNIQEDPFANIETTDPYLVFVKLYGKKAFRCCSLFTEKNFKKKYNALCALFTEKKRENSEHMNEMLTLEKTAKTAMDIENLDYFYAWYLKQPWNFPLHCTTGISFFFENKKMERKLINNLTKIIEREWSDDTDVIIKIFNRE